MTETAAAQLVEVAFRGNRKAFFTWSGVESVTVGTAVIVEADRGEDLGHVHAVGELAERRCRGCGHGCGTATPAERVLRLATAEEDAAWRALAAENETARRETIARVRAARLVMKVTDAEWRFDRKRLTIWFTAEKRVDFRDLVRDLAGTFRTRIELRQIGVRDEARRLGGVGRCGRSYCSASWLPELRPVNLGIAKDQRLSLNPQQISGACGRLMCCLRFEHDFYVQSRRRFPKEGKRLVTARGEETVMAIDIFRDLVTLRGDDGERRSVALTELKEELAQVATAAGGDVPREPTRDVAEPARRVEREPGAVVRDDAPDVRGASDVGEAPDVREASDMGDAVDVRGARHMHDAPEDARDDAGDDADDDDDAPPDAASADGGDGATGTDATPRKPRRRGRRGGRRRRSARGGDAPPEAPSDRGDARPADPDAPSPGDPAAPRRPDGAPDR